jgi:hypothetical protein
MRRNPFPLALLLIPAAALLVVLPLIVQGCSCGHDFDFHLISWMEAAAQFRAGVLHPAWAFSPAWNAGEPRFVFYPPVSWTLGALLGLMLPWSAVPLVYTWLALTASGFAMHRLARELCEDKSEIAAPLIAAAAYLANPYMIFTAYERTAYAELLAAAWIPLLFAAVLRQRVTVLRVAIPVALLWLTNAPAAVMGCYALVLLAAVRLVITWASERRISLAHAGDACLKLARSVVAGVALGLGLAAFYVLPAAYERRWVQIAMAMISGMRIEDNFLFHRTGDGPHDDVLHTASMIAVILLTAAILILPAVVVRLRRERTRAISRTGIAAISIGLLAAVIGLMLTPVSAAVWRVAPEMAFLQFPWRLTAVLAAAVCTGVALAVGRLRLSRPLLALGALAIAAGFSLPAAHLFRQECDDEDTVAARLAVFQAHAGTDPTDEYTPVQADNDSLAKSNPPFWLAQDADAPAPAAGTPGPVPMHFSLRTDEEESLVLNLRDYPAWQVRLNGQEITEKTARADGLIAFPVSPGRSRIDIAYTTTRDQRLGDGISLAAVCGALGLAAFGRRRSVSGAARSRIIED